MFNNENLVVSNFLLKDHFIVILPSSIREVIINYSQSKTKLIHRNNRDHDIRRLDMCLVEPEFP